MSMAFAVAVASTAALHAAGADKADRPNRVDKIERRLERANATGRTPTRDLVQPAVRGAVPNAQVVRSEDRNRVGSSHAGASFDPFRLIVERNIFDPTRIARTPRTTERRPRVDVVALVGTLESQKGEVAFFDGSSTAYKRVVHPGDAVGEFTVQSVEPGRVVLQKGAQRLSLRVAEQLRRPEGGEWTASAADPADPATTAVNAPAAEQPDAPPAIPANASDVLRRLMEQRQKQLNQ